MTASTVRTSRGAWELAAVNVALMRAPLHDPVRARFVTAFDVLARLAEQSPGFRWRLKADDGHGLITGLHWPDSRAEQL
jgi:hypothetical protein